MTVNKHAQCQDPESEAAKWNLTIIYRITCINCAFYTMACQMFALKKLYSHRYQMVCLWFLCYSHSAHREVLQAEAQAKMQASNPANFGPKKYCLRECICEVEGQVPCPGTTPLPKEMTGKYRAQMAASQE